MRSLTYGRWPPTTHTSNRAAEVVGEVAVVEVERPCSEARLATIGAPHVLLLVVEPSQHQDQEVHTTRWILHAKGHPTRLADLVLVRLSNSTVYQILLALFLLLPQKSCTFFGQVEWL